MKSSNADERLKKMLTALPNREETVNLFELLQRLQDAGITFEQLAKSTIIKLEGDIKAPKVINLFVDQPLPRAFTNFHRLQCELYQKAIDEWGKGTLFITDNAVDIDGKLIPDYMALNTSANGDISDFWKILRKLKSDSAVLG